MEYLWYLVHIRTLLCALILRIQRICDGYGDEVGGAGEGGTQAVFLTRPNMSLMTRDKHSL